MTEVWHTADCLELAVQCILTEDRMRRAREADAQSAFSGGVQRLHAAVIDFDTDPAAAPFISALLKLVGAQARSLDRPVPLSRWAEILEECFPDG
ncbi:hypothetical protein [Streptomyces sp. NPDC005907]|uniref:hypothetical protein n=1 Tax=Streptomyces sp. NPDC005907 TaxID=3154571 RepID=UPI0033E15CB3